MGGGGGSKDVGSEWGKKGGRGGEGQEPGDGRAGAASVQPSTTVT